MDAIEGKINKGWIEVRELINTPPAMKKYLKLEDRKVAQFPEELRAATLGGIVEFKKRLISGVFNFLTRLEFTTPDQAEILGCEAEIRVLIFILCLENQFATGQVKPAKEADGALAGSNSRNRPPVEEVVAEVKARVSNNPELTKNPHVKNIFMEIQLYQKEFAQFAALSPQIPDERAPTFFMNYKKRLEGILDNVHAHFRDIRMAEDAEMRKEFQRQEEELFVAPELVKLVAQQLQELAKVRTTIFHALDEGHQIRKTLVNLKDLRDPLLGQLDEELKLLDARQDPSATGHPTAVKLARSIASGLESKQWKFG